MSKSLITIATLTLLLLFSSAYYTTPADGRVGYQAPSLTIATDDGLMVLSQLRGSYVVVTFWSSDQPESRISNMMLNRAALKGNVKHVSINMDESGALYAQLRAVDGLQSPWQSHCDSASRDKLRRIWRQDGKFCSFLIAPDGQILLKDPTPQDLANL